MFDLKNAISPVIAIILLLAITVVISMSIYSFLFDYTELTTSSLNPNPIQGNIEIQHIFFEQLYLNSKKDINLSLLKITDLSGNELCSFSESSLNVNLSNLIGSWTFDELNYNGSHYMVEDVSGNGNDGILFDNNPSNLDGNTLPVLVKSNNGNALKFDGVDDYVSTKDIFQIDGATNLSGSAWIEISNFEKDLPIFGKDLFNSGSQLLFWRDNVASSSSGSETISVLVSSGSQDSRVEGESFLASRIKKEHVAFTFKNNHSEGLKLYINGVEVGSQSTLGINNLESNNNLFTIGSVPFLNRFFSGTIDNVMIFNRTLLESEIKKIYWDSINNQQEGISEIDISVCNLEKDRQYKILIIANNEKIESTQYVN